MTLSKCFKCSLFVSLIALIGCSAQPNFDILCGKWKQGTEKDYFAENWTCDKNGASGHSFEIQNGDTVFSENFNIKEIDGEWILYIQAFGQNGDAYIPFFLKTWEDSTLNFENLQHDFPKRITYKSNGANMLNAKVDGGEGSLQILEFTFERVAVKH